MRNTLDDDTVSAADSQRTPAAAAGFTAWVPIHLRDSVITRALWLYGLYSILSNAGYLTAYYLLPEGSLRGSPWFAPGAAIAGQQRFWIHLGPTLLINVAVLLLSVALNPTFFAPVGHWYSQYWPVGDAEVARLLAAHTAVMSDGIR